MSYDSREENAMILPVPIRRPAVDASLRFISLREYDRFFDELENGFPYSPPPFAIGCSGPPATGAVEALDVFEVGNYIASFVPNLSAFSRLDKRFTLPETTWMQVPQYGNYGFAVFQLAAGALKPHAMAFEFETDKDSLYFPTLHIHDGEVHATESFDHVLYLQHAGFDSRVSGYQNADVPDASTGLIRSNRVAKHFLQTERASGIVHPELLVHRLLMRGNHPNCDTEIVTSGDPIHATVNFRHLRSYLPWAVIGIIVAWFMSRCAKIKRLSAASIGSSHPVNGCDDRSHES